MEKIARKLTIATLLLTVFTVNSWSQVTFDDYRVGASMDPCTLTVYDPLLFSSTPAGHVYTNDNPVIDVLFEFRDNHANYFPNNWKIELLYTIDLYTSSGSFVNKPLESLVLTFDKNKPIRDVAIKSYPGYKKGVLRSIGVIFTLYNSGGPMVSYTFPANTGLLNWDDIVLTLSYIPDYKYSKSSTANVPIAPKHFTSPTTLVGNCGGVLPLKNEMPVSWMPQLEAESYDFEWVFVDIPEADFDDDVTIDWRNASRVNVKEPTFTIPLAYPRGKIIYRVRTISQEWSSSSSYYYRNEGSWSHDNGVYTSLVTTHNANYFDYCGMDLDQNWSYMSSFAEGGKLKEGLVYGDGLGRPRLTIGYDYESDNAILSKSYYDKQGRTAIQALPLTVDNSGNGFYGFYDDFDHTDFDTPTALDNAPSMGTSQAISVFYSSSNPFLSTSGQGTEYIPDAEGYPYAQVRYKNDGSGRADAVSMPGPNNKIGSGHETRFYYGAVDGQELLDRMFGNEIGFSEHYKKNMSTDPNGVTSVSYLDGSGRVVATALAGSAAMQNLEDVPHNTAPISVNLLDNLLIDNQGSVHNSKEIVVPVAGQYSFSYSLQGETYDFGCFEERKCVYDVNIKIVDEDGNYVDLTYGGGSVSEIDLSSVTGQSPAINFSAVLSPGKYTVLKVTSLNTSVGSYVDDLETYIREQGMGPQNPCIPQDIPGVVCLSCERKCELVYKSTVNLDGSDIPVWIAEDGLTYYTDNQGLHDAYPDDFVLDLAGTYITQIKGLLEGCVDLCMAPQPEVDMSECEIFRQVLLNDVSPGGQYFDNHPVTLWEDDPSQADKDKWLNMFVPVSVKNSLFTMASVSSWEELREVWVSDMALELLPYHPEYCQYDYFCNVADNMGGNCCKEGNLPGDYQTSGAYDAAMHIGHDDTYGLSGNSFFDPLALNEFSSGSVPENYSGICESRDPYFCENEAGYELMAGYLLNYIENPWGGAGAYFSIWDVLNDDGSSYSASNQAEQDLIDFLANLHSLFENEELSRYQFFRAYYQARKKQIIQNAFSSWAAENCLTCTNFTADACNDCVSLGTPTNCEACWLSFYDENNDGQVDEGYEAKACPDATIPTGGIALENFYIRYPYISALSFEDIEPDDLCETHCTAYANQWVAQLGDAWLGCEFGTAGFTQDMRNYLYQNFYSYCMGECSSPAVLTGTLPDFTTTTAQADLDLIVDDFMVTYSIDVCPRVHTNNTTDADKLPCQCGNLAEMISAAEALIPPYASPFHFDQYGVSVYDVVDFDPALDYMNDVLEQLSGSYGGITPTDLEAWITDCASGSGTSLSGLPSAFACEVNGYGPISCEDLNTPLNQIFAAAEFEQALDNILTDYQKGLNKQCLEGLSEREVFTMAYTLDEFQYTLYYYDRAGNLIKTVPPEGFQAITDSDELADAGDHRDNHFADPDYSHTGPGTPNPAFKRPDHRMATNYKYNSLEQLVESTTPDAGTSHFWYDEFGRLALSQNARQAQLISGKKRYSYTRYDQFGRIYEVGEISSASSDITVENVADAAWLSSFYASVASTRTQVTHTRYDGAHAGIDLPSQDNLRNRVASTYYFESAPNPQLTNYLHATHYSYDVHGNVKKSIQDFPFLNQFGLRLSETEYEYELVSGNVNKVSYRKGKNDQFYHRYSYDKDNRLVTVETSRDGKIWDTDAKYLYRIDGALYRIETGEREVQGTDYASTIQGWHKAVNAQRLNPTVDMGVDGRHVLATGDPNHLFARDAFAYTLHYFDGDYKRIGSSAAAFEADIFAGPMGSSVMGLGTAADPKGQYNGNIAAMVTSLRDHTENPTEELGQVFRYDQLYRLTSSRSFVRSNTASFTWAGINVTNNRWATNYTYDANGNIKTLQRYNEAATAVLMDNLTYYYKKDGGRLVNNRLYNVNDAGTVSTLVDDYRVNNGSYNESDPLGTGHFQYDEIGNLKQDKGETGTLNIDWNLYGKVRKVTRSSGTKDDLEFYYDASGRRVMKISKPHATAATRSTWKYTIFSYEAGGKLMAEYDIEHVSGSYTLNNNGHYLYGASRLGKTRRKIPVKTGVSGSYVLITDCDTCATDDPIEPIPLPAGDTLSRSLGLKQYEFSNHLGNVLVTISDRRVYVDDGLYTYSGGVLTKVNSSPDGRLDYYLPDVLSSSDYYPGGMPMPGRTYDGISCTTVSTAVTNIQHSQTFTTAGANSYTVYPSGTATLSNAGGGSGALLVTKVSGITGNWGVRSPAMALVPGRTYNFSFSRTLNSCSSGKLIHGWRIVNASGTVITSGTGTGTISGSFTVPSTGNYYLEVYTNSSATGSCSFSLDNVSVTYVTYTHSTSCSSNPADMYAWGFNGMLKESGWYGEANEYDFGARMYDSRLMRWAAVDKHYYNYYSESTYSAMANNPNVFKDFDGNDIVITIKSGNEKRTIFRIITNDIIHEEIIEIPQVGWRPVPIEGLFPPLFKGFEINLEDLKEMDVDALILDFTPVNIGVTSGSIQAVWIVRGGEQGVYIYLPDHPDVKLESAIGVFAVQVGTATTAVNRFLDEYDFAGYSIYGTAGAGEGPASVAITYFRGVDGRKCDPINALINGCGRTIYTGKMSGWGGYTLGTPISAGVGISKSKLEYSYKMQLFPKNGVFRERYYKNIENLKEIIKERNEQKKNNGNPKPNKRSDEIPQKGYRVRVLDSLNE